MKKIGFEGRKILALSKHFSVEKIFQSKFIAQNVYPTIFVCRFYSFCIHPIFRLQPSPLQDVITACGHLVKTIVAPKSIELMWTQGLNIIWVIKSNVSDSLASKTSFFWTFKLKYPMKTRTWEKSVWKWLFFYKDRFPTRNGIKNA